MTRMSNVMLKINITSMKFHLLKEEVDEEEEGGGVEDSKDRQNENKDNKMVMKIANKAM